MPEKRRAVALKSFVGIVFGEGIVAFLLPSGDHIVILFRNHAEQGGNLVGAVLHVGIHGDDHRALRRLETAMQRRRLTVIAAELNAVDGGIPTGIFLDDRPGAVLAAVIHENDFVNITVLLHDTLYPRYQFGERLVFVVQWNDY